MCNLSVSNSSSKISFAGNNEENLPKSVGDSQSLVTTLENFEFLVGMVIWNDVLFAIKIVSKSVYRPKVGLVNSMATRLRD